MSERIDLLVVGGGVNGAGIARDAAGRGLDVLLVERDDLAGHTSSASSKLIHGGLRYLEQYEFRLVREALGERERLLGIAPHIIWPLRFVLPHGRADRPAWMLRLGLLLYDNLARRQTLPRSSSVRFDGTGFGAALLPEVRRGFVYSDCWVEDSRLVVLNALDAAERGAQVRTRTALVSARREGALWRAVLAPEQGERIDVSARALVNAAGPWVAETLHGRLGVNGGKAVRCVKGSHIVVDRLYEGAHAYILQNPDKRIVFAIPYEGRFTLIGTTDVPWEEAPGPVSISPEETDYLCESVNRWFRQPIGPDDVRWSYAGVRPLYDDAAGSASTVTRDYVLDLEGAPGQAPVLSVYGGKITTYRRLAEHALERLATRLPEAGAPGWTASQPLPGGDLAGGFDAALASFAAAHSFLPAPLARRLLRAYGSRASRIVAGAQVLADLGPDLGGGLTTAEVDYLAATEWARCAEDILWRRSKLGLHVPDGTAERIERHLASSVSASAGVG